MRCLCYIVLARGYALFSASPLLYSLFVHAGIFSVAAGLGGADEELGKRRATEFHRARRPRYLCHRFIFHHMHVHIVY